VPLIALNFVDNAQEAQTIFTENGIYQPHLAEAMDKGNYLDFVYIFTYTAFLILLLNHWYKNSNRSLWALGMVSTMAVMFFDIFENIQMLSLTASLPTHTIEGFIAPLKACSWLKWGLLSITFIFLTDALQYNNALGKYTRLFIFFSAVMAIVALFFRPLAQAYTFTVAIVFVLLIAYSFTSAFSKNLNNVH
jgi:hypothetical protein